MTDKLKSRKFWLTLGAAILVLFGRQLGIELTDDQLWGTVALVASYAGAGQLAKMLQSYAQGGSKMLAGAVVQQVDDPTPIDGTEYQRVERKNTNPRGVKTLAALAITGALLTGCAHLDGWGEADRAIQAIDGRRLAACQESGQDVAKCMGISVGSDLVRHLLRRGAEIVTRLIVSRSGGGAEADSLTEAEAAALADEIEHIRALLEAEGVAL